LKVWDVATAKELARVRGITGARSVAFSPTGKTFATGHFGGAVSIRDANTGAERGSIKAHTIGVNALAFSKDGDMLATAGLDHAVKILDVKGLKERQVLRGH